MTASVATPTSRWWESYLVRYGIGTVVGAVCVKFLLAKLGLLPEFYLAPTVEPAARLNSGAIDAPTLFLLGALGLAYCYLASVPGLVVHAVRRHLVSKAQWLLVAVLVGFIGLALLAFLIQSYAAYFYAACLLTSFVFILTQMIAAWREWHSGTLRAFYQSLHQARGSGRFDSDSYRYLREHGNAFFIVLLEFWLLVGLLAAHAFVGLIGVGIFVVLCITPAATVYFLGHKIEAELI